MSVDTQDLEKDIAMLLDAAVITVNAIDSYGTGFASGSSDFWRGIDGLRAAIANASCK